MAVTDTPTLKQYVPAPPPVIAGGEGPYIQEELRKLRTCVETMISVMKKLETRISTAGW